MKGGIKNDMVTHRLRIGSWDLKISNLPDEEKKYPTVDKDNKELIYVPGRVERGYYVDPDTKEKVQKVYKRIGDKPVDKLKRTEFAEKYKETDFLEAVDLKATKYHLVEDVPSAMMDILKNGKAIKIIYTAGNGYNSCYGYIYIHQKSQKVILALGNDFISRQIHDIEQGKESRKKLIEATLQEGVERAKEEDLLTL